MDIRKIKKLMELLESSQLTELEIREGEESIRLARMLSSQTATPPPAEVAKAVAVRPAEESGTRAAGLGEQHREAADGHVITSPMVGTYYASPSPDSEAFVQVGGVVAAGDTLCIIEAMKIFNQIEADRSGTVRTVFKQTGDPVEYGELLFIIDTAAPVAK